MIYLLIATLFFFLLICISLAIFISDQLLTNTGNTWGYYDHDGYRLWYRTDLPNMKKRAKRGTRNQ